MFRRLAAVMMLLLCAITISACVVVPERGPRGGVWVPGHYNGWHWVPGHWG